MVQKFDEGKCDKCGLEKFEQEKVDQTELATNNKILIDIIN